MILHFVILHHESGQFPEYGHASTSSTRQSSAGRHATKWRYILRHSPAYHEGAEQSPNADWVAANRTFTKSCSAHPTDVCISTVIARTLLTSSVLRVTQLSLVKPEHNLSKNFSTAMAFEKQEFETCPDRVRDPHES